MDTKLDGPISDEELDEAPPYYRPEPGSPEREYLCRRREELNGSIPFRRTKAPKPDLPGKELYAEFAGGTPEGQEVSTTVAFVRLLRKLLRDPGIGPRVVPIIPDEARTFGMEALFRKVGIYSHVGQKYEPVDRATLLYYKEATDGQILEEGITEAGAMSSFIAAGTAYASHKVNTLPFFFFYSMFGFQRVGDLIWAAGDIRCRGFLVGATAGRTTLAGEGLQHQDGHSHILAYPHPNVVAYDPAFAYELAVIVHDGIRRMLAEQESVMYYITVGNEPYAMPAMPEGVEEGIRRGIYRFLAASRRGKKKRVRLLGSGALMNQVLAARTILEEQYGIAAEVWSVTSYKELHRDGLAADRWNYLHPGTKPRVPYVREALGEDPTPAVAVTDYVKALPYSIAPWVPGPFFALGTDGYGRSESRGALRDFFEVDTPYIVLAALHLLAEDGRLDAETVTKAVGELGIDPDKADPMIS